MYLKKLELVGFKSFAQKTALEFDRGIASIVGPNGSGKSNIADAIRWVLGEQSIKLLRGKRSEDVIFSGSSIRARLGMAEVSITLDNEDHQMPVDYPEVVITRRVYRNGESEYLLNKQPVRLSDIQLLLAKASFGHKSYSVIGQGMIDHILIATPAERKAFFDEAAGVRQYQMKREQAVSKLTETRENLEQARMLAAEIEPHLRTLTRQVRRLERRGVIEKELRDTQLRYYQRRFHGLLRQRKDFEAVAEKHAEQQRSQEQKLEKLQKELEALERERSRQEVFHELQSRYSQLLEQKNAIMKEQVVLEGAEELEAAKSGELNTVWLENRHRELLRSLHELGEEIGMLEREVSEKEALLKGREAEQKELLKELEALEASLSSMKERARQYSLNPEALEADFRVLQEEFLAFKDLLLKAETERDVSRAKKEVSRFDQRFASLMQKLADVKRTANPQDILDLHEALKNFFQSKDTLVNEIHALKREVERRRERLQLLTKSRERLDEDRARTERELERLAPGKGQARSTVAQRQKLEEKLAVLDRELQLVRESIVGFNQAEQKKKERLFGLQKAFRSEQDTLNAAAHELNAARVEIAKIDTRLDDLKNELRDELPRTMAESVTRLTADDTLPSAEPEERLIASVHHLKHQVELIGGIDDSVKSEYTMTEERYDHLTTQIKDMEQSLESLEKIIEELDETIHTQFQKSFQAINKEFGQYFKALFEGGTAKLVLQQTEFAQDEEEGEEDEEDEEEEHEAPVRPKRKAEKVIAGIEIIAQPPGKRVTGITMLSGGERALTSIALISAILATRPSPFVVLDEVDAALDEANSQRFAAILKELVKRSQFITITHNRATMQISSLLYGVTMSDDGVSKIISVKMEEAERVIERHGNR